MSIDVQIGVPRLLRHLVVCIVIAPLIQACGPRPIDIHGETLARGQWQRESQRLRAWSADILDCPRADIDLTLLFVGMTVMAEGCGRRIGWDKDFKDLRGDVWEADIDPVGDERGLPDDVYR